MSIQWPKLSLIFKAVSLWRLVVFSPAALSGPEVSESGNSRAQQQPAQSHHTERHYCCQQGGRRGHLPGGWNQLCQGRTVSTMPHRGGNPSYLESYQCACIFKNVTFILPGWSH